MGGNRLKELPVELLSEGDAFVSLKADEWLECFECLNGSLETDLSWLELMRACGLGHDGTNEVVSQNVSPYFFANKLGCFASQDVHLESYFDIPDIEFLAPSAPI